jgi:hypothetical protein
MNACYLYRQAVTTRRVGGLVRPRSRPNRQSKADRPRTIGGPMWTVVQHKPSGPWIDLRRPDDCATAAAQVTRSSPSCSQGRGCRHARPTGCFMGSAAVADRRPASEDRHPRFRPPSLTTGRCQQITPRRIRTAPRRCRQHGASGARLRLLACRRFLGVGAGLVERHGLGGCLAGSVSIMTIAPSTIPPTSDDSMARIRTV